jgi:hypothetical protein
MRYPMLYNLKDDMHRQAAALQSECPHLNKHRSNDDRGQAWSRMVTYVQSGGADTESFVN